MAFLDEDETFDFDDSPLCNRCGHYWENCICDELDDGEDYWELDNGEDDWKEDYYDSYPLDEEETIP